MAAGARFTATDDQQLGDTNYRVLQGSGFAVSDRIRFTFSDLPEPGFSQRAQNFVSDNPLVTFGLPLIAVVVMGAMLVYVFFVRDRRPATRLANGMTRDELVAEIAALDQRHESGEIEEDEYGSRRQELFDQALEAESAGEDEDEEPIENADGEPTDTR